MRFQRFGTFPGGLDLPEEKHATRDRGIEDIPLPPRLSVPLDPCALGSVDLRVSAGQRVKAGQLVAVAGGRMPVFASLAGIVEGLGRCDIAAGSSQSRTCESLEISHLSAEAPREPMPSRSWQSADADELIERISAGGLTTRCEPLQPLTDWLAQARSCRADLLIVNGTEHQPYLTSEHRLLVEHGPQIVEGIAIIRRAAGSARAVLAVDHRHVETYSSLVRPAQRHRIGLFALAHKYPTGHHHMLTMLLARREVPAGGSPFDVRVATIDVAACLAAYNWITRDELPLTRVITVSGDCIGRPGNYRVPVGTPAAHVLSECDVLLGDTELYSGGPMVGQPLPEGAVIDRASTALLAMKAEPTALPTACIRCGWCMDYCPVRLNVSYLNDLYELGQTASARKMGVRACLGCGVCSYVCPARLPLRHRMVQLAGRGQP